VATVLFILFPSLGLVKVASEGTGVRGGISDVFSLVLDAEEAGGDTTALVASLNEALRLVEEGEHSTNQTQALALFDQAERIVEQVRFSAWDVREAGLLAQRNAYAYMAVSVGALAVTALLAYVFVPRLFWMLWLKSHRNWRVKPR